VGRETLGDALIERLAAGERTAMRHGTRAYRHILRFVDDEATADKNNTGLILRNCLAQPSGHREIKDLVYYHGTAIGEHREDAHILRTQAVGRAVARPGHRYRHRLIQIGGLTLTTPPAKQRRAT
jgi:hypothetical protein